MNSSLKSSLLRYGIPFAAGLAIGMLTMAPNRTAPPPDKSQETPTAGTPGARAPDAPSPEPATAIVSAKLFESSGSSFRPILQFTLNGRLPAGANREDAEASLLSRTTVKDSNGEMLPMELHRFNPGNNALSLFSSAPFTNSLYTVMVRGGVSLGEGVSLAGDFEQEVSYNPEVTEPIYLAADIDSFTGRGTLYLHLNRDIDANDLAKHIEIDPPVGKLSTRSCSAWEGIRIWRQHDEIDRWDGESYGISGAFEGGKEYTLRLLSAAPGAAPRYRMTSDPLPFALPKPSPSIEFISRGTALASVGRRGVAVRSSGVPELRVELFRILPQNIPEFLHRDSSGAEGSNSKSYDDWTYRYGEPQKVDACDLADSVGKRFVSIGRSPTCDAVTTNIVALDDFAAEDRLPSGVYLIKCYGYDPDKEEHVQAFNRHVVALSDIGLTARRLGKSVHVWATRLSKAAPVAGATLEIYAPNNKLLATARTDGAGLGKLDLGEAEPSFVLAKTDAGEYAYITLDGDFALDELPSRPKEEYPTDSKTLSAFLFSDRGIYRHGEPVLLQGLVRNATGAAPDPLPLSVEFIRPDGRVVDTVSVKTDANGYLSLAGDTAWSAPDGQPSGTWHANLRTPGKDGEKLATRWFSVEEFVPPQIKVETVGLGQVIPAWQSFTFGANANYFFGSPAAGLVGEATLSFSFAKFKPEGYGDKWHFGTTKERYKPSTGHDNEIVGEDGHVNFLYPFTPALANSSEAVRVNVETTVIEPGGRPVSDRASGIMHPWTAYLGLEGASATPGTDLRVRLRLVAPDGSVATKRIEGLTATLTSIRHHYEYSRNDRGWWDWNDRVSEKEEASFRFDLIGGETNLVFALPSFAGDYRITVDPPEALTDLPPPMQTYAGMDIFRVAPVQWTFGAWGSDGDKSALAGPVRLQITPNAKEYEPGDVARLEVRAPFEGLALVTVQRDQVVNQSLITLTNGTGMVDVPVTASLAPNFEVALSCIRPVQAEASWGEHRAFGAVSIRVKDPARIIPVKVEEPSVEILPVGSRVAVDVTGGAPGARATVFLVDEAVLDLTDYKTPCPDVVFSRAFWSGAELYDTYRTLMRIEEGAYAKSAAIGGDDGASLRRRISPVKSRRFQPLALAKSNLAFENGSLRAVFDLPEFSGRVRAFAVVWTDRATGSAEASAKVAPKVVLQPDAARFLAPGDESVLSGALHNTTDKPVDLVWTCTLGGKGIAAPVSGAPIAGSLTLPASGSHTIRVPIRVAEAPSSTELSVTFTVKTAEESRTAELHIPVRPAFPLRPSTAIRALDAGATLTITPSSDFVAGTIETELSADPSPYAKFIPALRYLDAYPWGCLEQTVSRSLPLLYAQKANAGLSARTARDADERIQNAIAIIGGRMGDGVFYVWDDAYWTDPDYSAYAGFFLAEAENAGYTIPPALKTGYRHILRRIAGNVTLEPETRALAVLALENAGNPVHDWEQNLFDRRAKFSALAKYRLSLALRKAGQPDQAKELLLAATPKEEALDCAWGILAWLASGLPETDGRVAVLESMLFSARLNDSHWGTTRDNAAALLACAALVRRHGAAAANQSKIVLFDAGKSFLVATGKVARARTDLQRPFVVSNAGPSQVFLQTVASGLPAAESVRATTNGVSIVRRYFTRDHKPIDPAKGIPVGETIIAELHIEALGGEDVRLDDLVVEDLFPAGLEPRIGASIPECEWILPNEHNWMDHAEVRDDRLVLFSESAWGANSYYYALSAVSAGSYTLPPAQVECMYKPGIYGISEPGRLKVVPRDEKP